ncbi:MAG: radical SAM protein [Dehalococcoidia bacterium]|nr:radical SAM protein [Dehalococcoidia bacterium]
MQPLAVYVHIPFCTVKCGYCDFNAYSGMDNLKEAYGAALVAEVHANASLLSGRTIASIGFGGGTPGEVPAAHIGAVVAAIGQHARLDPAAEVTLEANPGTLDRPQLEALRAAGVTRLSIGAQSFHADELRFLDRIHSPRPLLPPSASPGRPASKASASTSSTAFRARRSTPGSDRSALLSG